MKFLCVYIWNIPAVIEQEWYMPVNTINPFPARLKAEDLLRRAGNEDSRIEKMIPKKRYCSTLLLVFNAMVFSRNAPRCNADPLRFAFIRVSHKKRRPTASVEILVPSIPALALLKIISWDDAYPERERDALDLLFILEKFESTDILNKLYESHVPLLTEEEFDPQFASVRLLGREIAQLGNTDYWLVMICRTPSAISTELRLSSTTAIAIPLR